MSPRYFLILLVSLSGAKAFQSTRMLEKPGNLYSSAVAFENHDESSYRQMLAQARELAFSDEVADARQAHEFLIDILHMESLCVSGVLGGDVCENVDEVADLVAHLREKAKQAEQATVLQRDNVNGFFKSYLLVFSCTTVLPPILIVLLSLVDYGRGDTPLTLNEWILAAKDGYLMSMVSHFLRNGGL